MDQPARIVITASTKGIGRISVDRSAEGVALLRRFLEIVPQIDAAGKGETAPSRKRGGKR